MSEAELSPDLERGYVPVPPVPAAAAAAIVEPPSAPQLELSEVHPHSATDPSQVPSVDVAPPPPGLFPDEAPAPSIVEPSALAPEGEPSPPAVTNAPAVTKSTDLAQAARIAEITEFAPVAEAVSAVPRSSARPPATDSSQSPYSRPTSGRKRSPAIIAAIWLVTATIPAAAVWLLMRAQKHDQPVAAAKTTVEYRAQTLQDLPVHVAPQPPAAVTAEVPSAPAAAPEGPAAAPSVNEPAVAAPLASTEAAPSTMPSLSPNTEVVVETDSKDRVSVLVKTRPDGARVMRRGKEIGRTPLVIQIGRGEHRIFEVMMVGFGTKRITLDGEKPEIMVNMATEAKPQTVYVPAPMPANKYDRLQ